MWQCSKSIGGGAATATDTTKGEPAPEPSSVGPKTKESSIAVAQAQPGHEFKQYPSSGGHGDAAPAVASNSRPSKTANLDSKDEVVDLTGAGSEDNSEELPIGIVERDWRAGLLWRGNTEAGERWLAIWRM